MLITIIPGEANPARLYTALAFLPAELRWFLQQFRACLLMQRVLTQTNGSRCYDVFNLRSCRMKDVGVSNALGKVGICFSVRAPSYLSRERCTRLAFTGKCSNTCHKNLNLFVLYPTFSDYTNTVKRASIESESCIRIQLHWILEAC